MIESARSVLSRASRIVCFSGAGLSAESGVPTFRDRHTGLWASVDPMTMASQAGFRADPDRVIAWYDHRRLLLADAQPNPAHLALARRPDILCITQNVDDLLERAGVPRQNVIHLHGTLDEDRCNDTGCAFRERIELRQPRGRRRCPECGNDLRPAVVWFGEMLPDAAWEQSVAACTRADVLLVVGTSGQVYPAAGLVDLARQVGAQLIFINTEPGAATAPADIELPGRAGEILPGVLSG